MSYRIECYPGYEHPALYPSETATASTEREARRIAARMLGHKSLRGASSWDRYQGGVVCQFGPRHEDNGYDYAVIVGDCPDVTSSRHDYDAPA